MPVPNTRRIYCSKTRHVVRVIRLRAPRICAGIEAVEAATSEGIQDNRDELRAPSSFTRWCLFVMHQERPNATVILDIDTRTCADQLARSSVCSKISSSSPFVRIPSWAQHPLRGWPDHEASRLASYQLEDNNGYFLYCRRRALRITSVCFVLLAISFSLCIGGFNATCAGIFAMIATAIIRLAIPSSPILSRTLTDQCTLFWRGHLEIIGMVGAARSCRPAK